MLEVAKAHMPYNIWRRKSETSYEMIYEETLSIINNA